MASACRRVLLVSMLVVLLLLLLLRGRQGLRHLLERFGGIRLLRRGLWQ